MSMVDRDKTTLYLCLQCHLDKYGAFPIFISAFNSNQVTMAKYYYPRKQYRGYSDLRELLDDKHQREGEWHGTVPEDPPSILKDPLRGDVPQHNNTKQNRNEFYRGRGRYQRRPFNYDQRGRGRNIPRGHSYRGIPPHPANIKVEFSTESGERKCQIETGNDISDKLGYRGRGGYRGRSFRGYRRGRGNRGSYGNYTRRPRDDEGDIPENHPHGNPGRNYRQSENRRQVEVSDRIEIEEEENWDLSQDEQQKILPKGESNDESESFHEENKEFHDVCKGNEEYSEANEYDEENYNEEYSEGNEEYYEEGESYHEEGQYFDKEYPAEDKVSLQDHETATSSEISEDDSNKLKEISEGENAIETFSDVSSEESSHTHEVSDTRNQTVSDVKDDKIDIDKSKETHVEKVSDTRNETVSDVRDDKLDIDKSKETHIEKVSDARNETVSDVKDDKIDIDKNKETHVEKVSDLNSKTIPEGNKLEVTEIKDKESDEYEADKN